MNNVFTLSQPMRSIFWVSGIDRRLRNVALVCAGVMCLVIASKISIPLQPVPITLQTLAVFFIAMTFGWRLGITTLISYITLGACGAPVFAGHTAGLAVLLGPTAGYILGFIPAMMVAAYLIEHGWGRHFISVVAAQLIASLMIFASGLAVLHLFLPWQQTIDLGLKPFLLTGSLKIIFLAVVIPAFWKKQ